MKYDTCREVIATRTTGGDVWPVKKQKTIPERNQPEMLCVASTGGAASSTGAEERAAAPMKEDEPEASCCWIIYQTRPVEQAEVMNIGRKLVRGSSPHQHYLQERLRPILPTKYCNET